MKGRLLIALVAGLAVLGCSQQAPTDSLPSHPASDTSTTSSSQEQSVSFVGTWKLEITDDLKEAAAKLNQPPPEIALEAHDDGTFDLWGRTANGEFEVSGEYFVQGRRVTLRAKEVDGRPPLLQSEDDPRSGTVSENGQTFTDESGSIWKRSQE